VTEPSERLRRIARLAPASDRERYVEEWRGDLESAAVAGLEPRDVLRGARKMAVRLRGRQVERALLGGRGVGVALGAWACVLAALIVAGVLGGPVLALVVVGLVLLVVLFARAGLPSAWSHWTMVVSIVVGLGALVVIFWSMNAAVDAEDALRPEPPIAAWTGPAMIVFVACVCGVAGSAVVAARRERRLRDSPDQTAFRS
jgi:hypothetical protein